MGALNPEPRRVDPTVLGQRRARRRERVTTRLLDAVVRLLERHDSYLAITVEQILEASELSRSTFYRYFEDKVDLILALGDQATADIITASQAIWELPATATREQVADAVHAVFEAYLPRLRLMTAIHEVSTYDARARERFGAAFAGARDVVADHIRTGQAARFVRADLPPYETAGWLTWMVEGGMAQMVQDAESPSSRRRLESSFAAILWHTLYDKSAGQPGDR